jgi:acetyltransferase-like isoleucine patch superfamily enzyme
MSELIRGNHVEIGESVQIYGKVVVGENTIIENNVVIGHPTYEMYYKYRDNKFDRDMIDSNDFETTIDNNCIIKSGTIIYIGAKIGKNVLCGHNVLIGEYSQIGDNSKIFDGSRIYSDVKIGNNNRINGFCCDRSVLGNNVSMLGNLVHKYPIPIGGLKEKAPIIENFSVIGMGATVIGDVIVHEGAYIGAGAVVTKNIPSYVYAVGIPAIPIKKRDKFDNIELINK